MVNIMRGQDIMGHEERQLSRHMARAAYWRKMIRLYMAWDFGLFCIGMITEIKGLVQETENACSLQHVLRVFQCECVRGRLALSSAAITYVGT